MNDFLKNYYSSWWNIGHNQKSTYYIGKIRLFPMKDKCKWFKFILVVHLFWILHPRTDKAGQNDYIFMLIAYITVLHISAGHAMFAYVPHFLFWGPLSKYKYFDISMWYCELWPHMFRITSSRCLTPPRIFSLNHTCDGWLQKSLWSIDHGKKAFT